MSDDAIHVSSKEEKSPDWSFATDDELKAHAVALTNANLAQLVALAEDKDRPVGSAPLTLMRFPGHLGANITRQTQYAGYVAEHAHKLGMTIRAIESQYDEATEVTTVMMVLARGIDIEIATAENEAAEGNTH